MDGMRPWRALEINILEAQPEMDAPTLGINSHPSEKMPPKKGPTTVGTHEVASRSPVDPACDKVEGFLPNSAPTGLQRPVENEGSREQSVQPSLLSGRLPW